MPNPDFIPAKGIDPTVRMQQRQSQFLVELQKTGSVKAACQNIGLSVKTYEKWCQRHPEFKRLKDSVRAEAYDLASEEKVVEDFPIFRKKYFGHDSPPAHVEMADALETPGKIVMILFPPFFGKTTNLADKMCQLIAGDPNIRIGYVTESQPLANKVCGRLRRRMTDVKIAPRYMSDFGPFYVPGQEKQGKPWGAEFFSVFGSSHDENDYTFEALGWSSQIYGARWDVAVLDDYQTLRNTRNKETTRKMVETFQQDILTRVDLGDGGRIIIIGTRVAQFDFYIKLIEDDIPDIVVIRPAINGLGESLWPDKWTVEKLERQKKAVGQSVWARAYMMRPQDDGQATFTQPIVDAAKVPSLKLAVQAESHEEMWAGIDPAVDKWTAMSAAAVSTETFRLAWIDHYWELSRAEAILSKLHDMWVKTRFTKLIVEVNAFQKALGRDERLEQMKRECGFEVVEHVTGANKADPTFGVARMASSFIDESFLLPWSAEDEETQPKVQAFIDELTDWRASIPTRLRVQDMIMAVWFPWMRWQQFRKDLEVIESAPGFQTQGMPFSPTGYGRFTEYAPLVRSGS